MRQNVERYIEVCKPCAARRTQGKKLVAELKPFIEGTRFHKVGADILGPVTLTKDTSFKYILVMTDLFTKYVVTVPLANQTASSVAEAIIQNWFLRFGTQIKERTSAHRSRNELLQSTSEGRVHFAGG